MLESMAASATASFIDIRRAQAQSVVQAACVLSGLILFVLAPPICRCWVLASTHEGAEPEVLWELPRRS